MSRQQWWPLIAALCVLWAVAMTVIAMGTTSDYKDINRDVRLCAEVAVDAEGLRSCLREARR